MVDLELIFHPRTVAVIGAEDAPHRNSTLRWHRVTSWAGRTGGSAIPIRSDRRTVSGLMAYPTVQDVPGDSIDVVVVLTNEIGDALRGLRNKRVRFLVNSLSEDLSIYAEEVHSALTAAVQDTSARLVGPTNVSHMLEYRDDLPGRPIAIVTQSGFQGQPLFAAQQSGIRVSHWLATGSETDLESAEVIDYFADLPGLGAIAASLEGFEDGHAFLSAAAKAARKGVPLVMVKVGRSELGRSWAQSHTGRLAGQDHVVSAAMRQYGVIRVDGLDELLDTAMLFARSRPTAAPGICVCSLSGGNSAHMGDLMRVAGLSLPTLAPATQERLRQLIPVTQRVDNPIDTGAPPVTDERGRQILEAILDDPAIGILVVAISAPGAATDRLVADVADLAGRTDKLVCLAWGAPPTRDESYGALMRTTSLPVFQSYGNCITALKAYLAFHEFQRRLPALRDPQPASPAPEHSQVLDEFESKRLLAGHGIPVTDDRCCDSPAAAAAAAESLGGPVVVKALSPDIAHKTDLGLVRLGVRGGAAAERAYRDFERTVSLVPQARWRGVLVSEQVHGGVELAVGIASDSMFGPVVMVGFGGVALELYRDVAFRLPPFSRDEARRMLDELVGLPRLTGFRGAAPADLDAVLDVVMAVQQLALDGAAVELDVNPLLVLPDRVVALDAVARVASRR